MDTIKISALTIPAIIGLLPHERIQLQPLRLQLLLSADLSQAAASGDLAATMDYSVIPAFAAFLWKAARFELLESAAEALAQCLLHTALLGRAPDEVRVSLEKPEVFAGNGTVEVTLTRQRLAVPPTPLFRLPNLQIAHIALATGDSAAHPGGSEINIFAIDSGLAVNDLNLQRRQAMPWPGGLLHNPTRRRVEAISVQEV